MTGHGLIAKNTIERLLDDGYNECNEQLASELGKGNDLLMIKNVML
jgi:hypothetical protein